MDEMTALDKKCLTFFNKDHIMYSIVKACFTSFYLFAMIIPSVCAEETEGADDIK